MTRNIEKIRDHQSISFEFFPPRTEEAVADLFNTIDVLKTYNPDFVSCTYGALGTTRDTTVEVIERIHRETPLEPMCHLTVVAQTSAEVNAVLERLSESGIENILALRGDPPKGDDEWKPTEGGFMYSVDLIDHIKKYFPHMGVGAACFPEGHLEAPSLEEDIKYAKMKLEHGADFLITQLFFDTNDYYNFLDLASKAGITAPIVVGVLPILSTRQIRRFASLCGAKIPKDIDERLEELADDDEACREFGIDIASKQVDELNRFGVSGFHFYVLNRHYSVGKILGNTGLLTKRANII